MDEVLPGLWVGGVRAAMDADYLSRAGITHIITCMKQQIPVPPPLADGRTITRPEMKHVRIDDDEKAPILVHFAGCNELISSQLEEEWVADEEQPPPSTPPHQQQQQQPQEESLDQVEQLVQGRQKRDGRWGSWQTTGAGTVLVHCQAGCSRSVAIVAAYLMNTRHISATTAVAMIQRRRHDAGPNAGFMAQLELYEQVGFEVDMKWQAVRRFLMSKTDILNGDSMDDMLLSYYPSPYPSPALNASGIKGFTSIRDDGSSSTGGSSGGGVAPSSSTNAETAEIFNTKKSTAKPLSRSASSCPSASTSSIGGQRISHLSSISMPPSVTNGVSNLTDSMSNMATPSSSSSSSNTEVKVTANSSGRLPGGVAHVRGHEGVANRGSLAQPSFSGPKLRCKGCRRELAALDHVVIHEPGKGQMAFDHRRRDAGFGGQTVATDSSNPKDEEESATVANQENVDGQAQGQQQTATATPGNHVASTSTGESSSSTAAPSSAASTRPKIQSAASLASQLPPHLAALRGARPRPTPPQQPSQPSHPAQPPTPSSSPSTNSHAPPPSTAPPPPLGSPMLKHPSCSSYFVEPMAWMTSLSSGQVTGRLNCPSSKCGAKLGSWDWAGMQCACGAWVTPAFSLHRSKVDEV